MAWLFGDVLDFFGVELTPVTRMWAALGVGGDRSRHRTTCSASRWWRKAIAALSIPLFVLAAAAGINVDFGAYRNLNDAIGVVPYQDLALHAERGEVAADRHATTPAPGRPPGPIPPRARSARSTSRRRRPVSPRARPCVYLPPAALTAGPARRCRCCTRSPASRALPRTCSPPAGSGRRWTRTPPSTAASPRSSSRPTSSAAPDATRCASTRPLGNSATYLLDGRPQLDPDALPREQRSGGVGGLRLLAGRDLRRAVRQRRIRSCSGRRSRRRASWARPSATRARASRRRSAAPPRPSERRSRPRSCQSHAPYTNSLIVFGVGQNDAQVHRGSRRRCAPMPTPPGSAPTCSSRPAPRTTGTTVRYVTRASGSR